ncbi:MAG: hypothetical protein Tsb0020_25620 [Haliangiales bacterium]
MALSPRQKRIVYFGVYPILALLIFFFVFHWSFPYGRIKNKLIALAAPTVELQIAEVDSTFWPGGLVFDSVLIKTRPKSSDDKPAVILVDTARVDVGLLSLLGQRLAVDIVATIGAGEVEADLVLSETEFSIELETEALPLETVPDLGESLGLPGLPVSGGLNATVALTVPEQRLDLADGSLSLSCSGCIVGDGKAKLKPSKRSGSSRARSRMIFSSGGLTVPPLNLGELTGTVTISGGRGVIEQFAANSDDGNLALFGSFQLAEKFSDSRFEKGCIKFRLSDSLKQREREFGNVPNLMGVPPDDSGYSNMLLQGKLAGARWRVATNCESDGSAERFNPRAAARTSVSARGSSARASGLRGLGDDDDGDDGDDDMGDGDDDVAGLNLAARRGGDEDDEGDGDDANEREAAAREARRQAALQRVDDVRATDGEGRRGAESPDAEREAEREAERRIEQRELDDENDRDRADREPHIDDLVDDDEGLDGEEGEEDDDDRFEDEYREDERDNLNRDDDEF